MLQGLLLLRQGSLDALGQPLHVKDLLVAQGLAVLRP